MRSNINIRFGLRTKLFTLVFVSFSLLLLITSWRIDVEADKVSSASIKKSLAQTSVSLQTKIDSQFNTIRETAKNFARDGRVLPLVYDDDSITLQDLSLEFKKSLDFDILFFTNSEGIILARSDRPSAIGQSIAGKSALFDQALSGQEAHGIINSRGRMLQIVAVPILDNYARDLVRGTVALAYELSPKSADEINQLTASDIGFYIFSRDEKREVNGVQSIYNTRPKITSALDNYFEQQPDLWQSIQNSSTAIEGLELDLNDEHLISVIKPLSNSSGNNLGFIIALQSQTELLKPFFIIQRQLLITGLICLIFGSIIAWLIAQRISKPIVDLVAVSRQIQDGESPSLSDIKPNNDEIGALQLAVYKMGQNLKNKAELETYLADLSDSISNNNIDFDIDNITDNLSLDDVHAAEKSSIAQSRKSIVFKESNDVEQSSNITNLNNDITSEKISSSLPPVGQNTIIEGTLIDNRYIIAKLIGSGAMAEVYLAKDGDLNELVALKIMSHESMKTLGIAATIKDEIRLARRITHRNILRTFDFGTYGDNFYITMEFVHGFSLESLIKQRGKLEPAIGIIMARQIALALQAAHEQNVIHLDLKPANMMINRHGIIKIMDFGLARTISKDGVKEDKVSGTPRYMAPEQFLGESMDQRTDIYAIGVILYVIFTGKPPYDGKDLNECAASHISEAIPSILDLSPNVPVKIDLIVSKAMQKTKDDRYESVNDLLVDLDNIDS
jgi:serine/threonine-protein kinase